MKEDRVALWLESIAEDETLPPQPTRAAIRRWLDQRARERILAIAGMNGWYCIAADEDLACGCGSEPYTDGELCPKCWAVTMFEIHVNVLDPSKKKRKVVLEPCRKSEPKVKAAD